MIVDLHVHSRYSPDSLSSPMDIIKCAKKNGLDAVAITDHGSIEGALHASKANTNKDFLIVVGEEIATERGDIIGLFLSHEIRSTQSEAVIQEIRDQDGIVVLPHPFRGRLEVEDLSRAVDAIEVFNSRERKNRNAKSLDLARRLGKPMVGGSDAHFCLEIGLCTVESETEDLRNDIIKGRIRLHSELPSWVLLEPLSHIIGLFRLKRYKDMPSRLGWDLAGSVRKR